MFISLKWVICPENEITTVMSLVTHIHYKNTNNCFQIGAADIFECETVSYFPGIFVNFRLYHVFLRPFNMKKHGL